MARGRLRVLLGAAPGVGKTFAMLEEGHAQLAAGRDVVVAVIETHGRKATAALTDGLEIVPRRVVEHRGVRLEEMDLDAVVARAPQLALVDELAHSNAPGMPNEKRWQDVEALLDAGIDVVSTLNVQHIESLADVVQSITGVSQRETVPDAVLRGADQVEVVDLAPGALRDRLSAGQIYPAERIDAALSNFFRLGNLTALRELALLWLADEVDDALRRYRDDHGISDTWEARERVVVALTGGPEGETLIRRGARIAARSAGGQVMAVHVSSQDGLREAHPGALAAQRALVERLGGSYHQVVGDDVPVALVDFARGAGATQLVIGVSRRSRLAALLTGPGIGATVIRESGEIDVHIVTHQAAGGKRVLPRLRGALTARRRVYGLLVAVFGIPAATWLLSLVRTSDTITAEVLSFQLLVIVVALVGGIWPALFAAVVSGFALDFFFVAPLYQITISEPAHFAALLLSVASAVLVSFVVDRAARHTRRALRSTAESELLATIAGGVLRGDDALVALIEQTREAFGLERVRLLVGDRVIAESVAAGELDTDALPYPAPDAVFPVEPDGRLELTGRELRAGDRRLVAVIAAQAGAALARAELERAAEELAPLVAADRVRSALLAAVGHDLRRPLAAATAAVTGLRTARATLSQADREELLSTAEESLAALGRLLTDLLDVSRVQSGALGVRLGDVDLDDVVSAALDEVGADPGQVELELAAELEPVRADAVLLVRVLVNLVQNALRFTPQGQRVLVAVSEFGGEAQLRVVDRGPGIPADRRDAVFVPFQRLGDTDNDTGLGLGLALAKGFVEGMGGTIEAEDTPGGGATMVVTLPSAASADAGAGTAADADALAGTVGPATASVQPGSGGAA